LKELKFDDLTYFGEVIKMDHKIIINEHKKEFDVLLRQ
jgi:hypothetical protein